MNRYGFMFSNRSAQRAEAQQNAAKALELLAKFAPPAPRPASDPAPGNDRDPINSAATQCFRRVTAILAGRTRP